MKAWNCFLGRKLKEIFAFSSLSMYLKNVFWILNLRKKPTEPVYQLIGHFVVTSLTGFDKDQTKVNIEEKKACPRKGNTALITQLY